MSFRRRLSLTTTALVVTGYIAFAVISLALLEQTLRSVTDAKLMTIARAASDIVDDDHGRPAVDADDVAQIDALHGSDEHLAIFARSGRIVFGESAPTGAQAGKLRFARASAIHNGHDLGWVVAWANTSWIVTVRNSAIVAFLLTGSVLGGLAFFFSGAYARTILAPVERIANLAERLESSDLSQRLNANGRDELARLCASFDRMLERLQRSFESERRFVSDASHELRAPLAVVRAETDLALRRERSAAEYRLALESIDRETKRLEELVDHLLQTMRDQAVVEIRTVDVSAVVCVLAERMRHAAEIVVHTESNDAFVDANQDSLERALSAVLHNAIAHGGGVVRIELRVDSERVRIVIADGGTGFSEQALSHATERFWRGDSARSRGGTGLGLSIARILTEAQGGSLQLDNAASGGAIVTIALPRAHRIPAAV